MRVEFNGAEVTSDVGLSAHEGMDERADCGLSNVMLARPLISYGENYVS